MILQPGLIVLKKFFSEQDQIKLANVAKANEKAFLPSARNRTRIYTSLDNYLENRVLLEAYQKAAIEINKIDPNMPIKIPTHLLSLLYEGGKARLGWHVDNSENDGDASYSIVSFCIGNTCEFWYKDESGEAFKVTLESGDVIVFGGPMRYMWHKVGKVRSKTSPDNIQNILGNMRLNYTFRYVPSIKGKEDDFKVFDAKKASIHNKNKKESK